MCDWECRKVNIKILARALAAILSVPVFSVCVRLKIKQYVYSKCLFQCSNKHNRKTAGLQLPRINRLCITDSDIGLSEQWTSGLDATPACHLTVKCVSTQEVNRKGKAIGRVGVVLRVFGGGGGCNLDILLHDNNASHFCRCCCVIIKKYI